MQVEEGATGCGHGQQPHWEGPCQLSPGWELPAPLPGPAAASHRRKVLLRPWSSKRASPFPSAFSCPTGKNYFGFCSAPSTLQKQTSTPTQRSCPQRPWGSSSLPPKENESQLKINRTSPLPPPHRCPPGPPPPRSRHPHCRCVRLHPVLALWPPLGAAHPRRASAGCYWSLRSRSPGPGAANLVLQGRRANLVLQQRSARQAGAAARHQRPHYPAGRTF